MTSDAVHLQPLSRAGQASSPGRPATAGDGNGSVFNPYLIALGIIYVLWSWVHLPSSIWVRSLFACYLIWRMKPDIIIPFVLSCVQLRIELGGRGGFDEAHGMAQQMTGFEQYAFIIPCILYFIRTFFAACSVRVTRRAQFPFWLYNLYLFGMLFVVAGALSAYGTRGWSAGVRQYCVPALYFYGMLMPACSKKQLMQLVAGFAMIGMITVLAALTVHYNNRQLWVLLPIAGNCAPLMLLGGGGFLTCVMAAAYSVAALAFALRATFTLLLLWSWNMIAGGCLALCRKSALRGWVITGLTYALVAVTLCLLIFAAVSHDPTRDLHEKVRGGQGSTYDRMTFKLLSDRGPIWAGAMRELATNPTLCGIPAPEFVIHSMGQEVVWPYSTHSILLDPLLQLGIVAGPLELLVLLHAVMVARNAIARETHVSIAVLGLAVISNIVLGGATLPYMLSERVAEHMLMVAGLLDVYGYRRGAARTHVPLASSQLTQYPPVVPAA
jgi:hypothetical protein